MSSEIASEVQMPLLPAEQQVGRCLPFQCWRAARPVLSSNHGRWELYGTCFLAYSSVTETTLPQRAMFSGGRHPTGGTIRVYWEQI